MGRVSRRLFSYTPDYKKAVIMQDKDTLCFAPGGNTGNPEILKGVFL